jgi:ubiquinone biosynthesis protein UbiJ
MNDMKAQLTESHVQTVIRALHVAAEQYRKDMHEWAQVVGQEQEAVPGQRRYARRMVEDFRRQEDDCKFLAAQIEEIGGLALTHEDGSRPVPGLGF